MKPKLTLVGAGPGDPELISLKGIKALERADVVLYDALAHPDLLDYCRPEAEKIFVGKRAGMHSFQQEQINRLIIEHALNKGHVVRLKGGDPFIFGRGKEEIEYAEAFGIDTDVVPGISSINLPGYYGIPLTKRGVNESFWVITAVTRDGMISKDLKLAANSSATIVVLMGLKKLSKIVKIFKAVGKEQLPVAIISKGSLANGSMLVGRVDNIEKKVLESNPKAPSLLVFGEVVAANRDFHRQAKQLGREYLIDDERFEGK